MFLAPRAAQDPACMVEEPNTAVYQSRGGSGGQKAARGAFTENGAHTRGELNGREENRRPLGPDAKAALIVRVPRFKTGEECPYCRHCSKMFLETAFVQFLTPAAVLASSQSMRQFAD